MAQAAVRRFTYVEYLDVERATGVKHEFADGVVWSMAGGTPAHAELAARVARFLGNALDPGPCRPLTSDLRIRVPARNRAYHADVPVICGPIVRDLTDGDAATNPTVLVEVLSTHTEQFDRGDKFDDYGTLDSLKEYVLVSTDRVRVEVFHREDDGTWRYVRLGPDDTLRLASLDVVLPIRRIFEGVELEPMRTGR